MGNSTSLEKAKLAMRLEREIRLLKWEKVIPGSKNHVSDGLSGNIRGESEEGHGVPTGK